MGAEYFEIDYQIEEEKFWLQDHPESKELPEECDSHPNDQIKQVETKRITWNYRFRFKACKKCGRIFDFRWIDARDLYNLGLIDNQVLGTAMLPHWKNNHTKEESQEKYNWFMNK